MGTSRAPGRAEASRTSIRASELEFVLLGRKATREAAMRRAYELWHAGFSETLRELSGVERVDSDEFTRQDEIGAFVLGGECIAVTGLRWVDFSLPMARHDSYFRRWPEDALVRLETSIVGITGNTLIAPGWRGARIELEPAGAPIALKFATIALPVRRFASSSARFIVGVARTDRGMDRAADAMGFVRIGVIDVHGVKSAICVAERSKLADTGPAIEDLWRRRKVEGEDS